MIFKVERDTTRRWPLSIESTPDTVQLSVTESDQTGVGRTTLTTRALTGKECLELARQLDGVAHALRLGLGEEPERVGLECPMCGGMLYGR